MAVRAFRPRLLSFMLSQSKSTDYLGGGTCALPPAGSSKAPTGSPAVR